MQKQVIKTLKVNTDYADFADFRRFFICNSLPHSIHTTLINILDEIREYNAKILVYENRKYINLKSFLLHNLVFRNFP